MTLVLTTKSNETKHYVHLKHKKTNRETALANKTN